MKHDFITQESGITAIFESVLGLAIVLRTTELFSMH